MTQEQLRISPLSGGVSQTTLPPGLPEHTLGWFILAWAFKYLSQPDGPDAGESFLFTDEQTRLILWWYAVDENGRFLFNSGVVRRMKGWGKDPFAAAMCLIELCAPTAFSHFDDTGNPVGKPQPAPWVQVAAVSRDQTRNTFTLFPTMCSLRLIEDYGLDINKEIIHKRGGGRIEAVTSSPKSLEGGRSHFVVMNEALDLDTPMFTVEGWKRFGDLVVGDSVFGPDGRATKVVGVGDVQYGRRTYKVSLRNGDSVVASDGHLWGVKLVGTGVRKVMTTQELLEDGRRFSVPHNDVLETPDVPLPVDPYVLGLWLGDGDSSQCNISGLREDLEFYQTQINHSTRVVETSRTPRLYLSNYQGTELSALRYLPCFTNKHIPELFLRAGTQQRISLLQGLMDSDGCVSKSGFCIWVGNEKLKVGVLELLRSVGQRPYSSWVEDDRSRNGGYWRVTFTPRNGVIPVRLPRKVSRVRSQTPYGRFNTITSIEEIPTRPVRCIEVDNDSHTFLAGEGLITTHNTQFWLKNNNGHEMRGAIQGNVAKGRGGSFRLLSICNAHRPGEESVAEEDYNAFEKIMGGGSSFSKFFYDALEAPPDTDIYEVESLRHGVSVARGDSVWLDVDRLVEEIHDPRTVVSEARRKYLNQIVAAEDSWLAPWEWDANAQPLLKLRKGDRITLGFDGSRGNDHTALCACRVEDGAIFLLNTWNPESYPNNKIPTEAVDRAVRHTFATFDVVCFRADVKEFESYIDQWSADFRRQLSVKASPGNLIAYDMRSKGKREFLVECERFRDAVIEGALKHDGNVVLRQHVLNARQRPSDTYDLIGIGKETKDSDRKIDAAVTAVLAFGARQEYLKTKYNRKKSLEIM